MISVIVDVAHALSVTRLAQRDYRAAQEAAAQGLLAESSSELLYRDALRAAAARGDTDEAVRLADRLRTQITRKRTGRRRRLRRPGRRWRRPSPGSTARRRSAGRLRRTRPSPPAT